MIILKISTLIYWESKEDSGVYPYCVSCYKNKANRDNENNNEELTTDPEIYGDDIEE